MRKKSIARNLKTLMVVAAIVVLAFALCAAAFMLPVTDVKTKAEAQNTEKVTGSSPSTVAVEVPENSGKNSKLEVLGEDEISGLEDGGVPNGSLKYIEAKKYAENADWMAIDNATKLLSWLKDGSNQGKNAYLVGNINDFNYGAGANATADGNIQKGKVLDGCGYTINIALSGHADKNTTGKKATAFNGFFVNTIYGTLKNAKFTLTYTTPSDFIKLWGGLGAKDYFGLLAGSAGGESNEGENLAIVENVSLEILPFASGGYLMFEGNGGGTVGNCDNAQVRYGNMFGAVKNAVVRNCSVIQTGGDIRFQGNEGKVAWVSYNGYAQVGGIIGLLGFSSGYPTYAYNLSVYGNGTKYTKNKGETHNIASIAGRVEDSTQTSDYTGFYAEFMPNQSGFNYSQLFVGESNGQESRYNKTLYAHQEGTRATEAFTRLEPNISIKFMKPDPYAETLKLAEYQAQCTKVILNDTNTYADGKILWRVNRAVGVAESTAFDSYNLYDKMLAAKSNLYITLSTKVDGAAAGTGGNRLHFLYGDKLKLTSIESKTVTYNGEEHTTAPVFKYVNDTAFNADSSKYTVLYNNKADNPILPATAPYAVSVRAAGNDKLAYFDETARVIAPINDIEASIKINVAPIEVTAVNCGGATYGGNYVNKPIDITVAFTSTVKAPSDGYKVKYQQIDPVTNTAIGLWSAEVSGMTAAVVPSDGFNTGDKYYRLALLANRGDGTWIEVSSYSAGETFFYDDFVPETQFSSTYAEGTWHTSAADVIINPKPTTRYASASVQVRFVDSSGNPVAGDDGIWHKADGTFQNEDGAWVDGFKVSSEGKTYFQLKAMAETGAEGNIQSYEVWIDRNDYSVDYTVALASAGTAVDKSAITINGKTTFKRSERVKLTMLSGGGDLPYYIAEVDGKTVKDLTNYVYTYEIPLDMAIGGTPDKIAVKVKKGVRLTLDGTASGRYGDAAVFPEPTVEGLLDGVSYADLGVNMKFVSDEVTDGGAKAVGKHEYTASITNYDYVLTVVNAEYEVTARELPIQLKKNYRFELDTYLGYGADAWKELKLDFKEKNLILSGDSVNITGVTYDKEIDAYGAYNFTIVLDNENYAVPADEKGRLLLTMLEYDYDAIDGLGAYKLGSAADFEKLNDFPGMLTQNFILTANIDLTEFNGKAIKGEFSGIFEGGNHTLYNIIMVDYDVDNYGLFYSITGGTIRNLAIDNMSINIATVGSESNVGILAGTITNATIDNVIIRGEIHVTDESGTVNAGVIAGKAIDSTIKNVAYLATFEVYSSGKTMVGGLVGDASGLTVENAEYIGVVKVVSSVTTGSVGYVTATGETGSNAVTVSNVKYIDKSAGFNGERVTASETAPGTSSTYKELANSETIYGGTKYGTLVKTSVDKRYFGENVYGTDADDAFLIGNYNQLVATVIYPYATFKLTRDVICHTMSVFDVANFFGTIDLNGFGLYDISGAPIELNM